jgi:hypothetical protein
MPGACKIRQHTAPHAAGDGKKMGAVLPTHGLDVHQAKVNLIHQGGGLQSVTRIFPGHAAVGHAVEFLFDYGVSLFECLVVSAAPRLEKLCDFDFRETLRTVHGCRACLG